MLDPWIIEQIRRREEEEREQQDQRPVVEIPLDRPREPVHPGSYGNQEQPERGVAILNYSI